MILTVEQTKEFFRANKEAIKGKTVVFRWNRNQDNGKTLKEIGTKILELENRGTHFSFTQIWLKENENPRDTFFAGDEMELFIERLRSGEITAFCMSPDTPMTHAERMSAGHYGKLD